MRTATININGKDHKFAYGLRPMFLFEQISGKRFDLNTLTDTVLFYWCCFISADADFMNADINAFIELMDSDPSVLVQCGRAVKDLSEKASDMDGREPDSSDDDKKKD